jgi:hypothetical protein
MHWTDAEILLGFDGLPYVKGSLYVYPGARTLVEAQAAHRAWLRGHEIMREQAVTQTGRRTKARQTRHVPKQEAFAEYDGIMKAFAARAATEE